MPQPTVRGFSSALDASLRRLDECRADLAKAWLLRVLERAPLEDIQRIPTDRVARELPDVIGSVVRAVAEGGEAAAHRLEGVARRIAAIAGREHPAPSELVADIAALQAVLLGALGRELEGADTEAFADGAVRLAGVFGGIQAAAADELVRERSRELEWLANTDALTGLYNVRYLKQQLAHLVGIQQRYGDSFALLLLDINGLKRINDAHGHAAGDRILVGVSAAIRETVRTIDTPVRMGGDEFCVLAPHQTASGGKILAYRIGAAVEQIDCPGNSQIGVAIGVVSCPQHGVDPEQLLELADSAMYRAKASGERVAVGSPSDLALPGDDAEAGSRR
ncbi:MAG: GGDEF domain-containing protein [Thermoleophilaceae bacterium]|nr:GGDEF domain-containing protein [Thermoleophilaceae bacterium]